MTCPVSWNKWIPLVWLCVSLYTTDPTLSDLNSAMVCGISRKVPSPSPKSSLYTDSSAVKSSVSNVSSLNVDISTISSLAVQSHKCKSLMNISLCCWRLRHCLIGSCVSFKDPELCEPSKNSKKVSRNIFGYSKSLTLVCDKNGCNLLSYTHYISTGRMSHQTKKFPENFLKKFKKLST